MGPGYSFGGFNIDICMYSLPNLFSHSENLIFLLLFVCFEAKAQPQEQLIKLTTDIVLVATGAVSFGFWALVTVKGGGHRSEKSGKTRVCQNTWKHLTRRPHSCCTICMNTSEQILFSHAIHRPAAAGLIGEVATQVWYWTGALTTRMNNTEFWATR